MLTRLFNSLRTKILLVIVSIVALSSCSTVKNYQRMYIDDSDMELGAKRIEKFEMNFQLYREGAAGANGGKSGGGCGCN